MRGAKNMKMNLKQVKYLIWALAIACIVMIGLLYMTKSMVFFWLMLAVLVIGVAVNLALWRCPYCGQHLGNSVSQYCTHCGKRLDDLG